MRKAIRVVLIVVGALVVIVVVALAALVFPRAPGVASSLHFQGFVPLPGKGTFQVLDYLTVYQRQLFVTNVSSGDVYRIGLHAKAVPGVADISVLRREPAAHGVAIDSAGGVAFVTRSGANAVDAFDPPTMRFIRRMPVANDPDAILYDPRDRLIYAASGDSMLATLIDPARLKTVGTIALGASPEFALFDPKTGLVFQNLSTANAVAAVNVAARRIVWRFPLQQCEFPTGMAIDESDRRLFIACGKSARLVVFDPDRRRVVAGVPIGFGPDSVAYDPELHRIYTTGLMGTLSVIEQNGADAYRVRDTIRLPFNAHTLAIDPVTHDLYVGCTGFVLQPRLAVFNPVH